MRGEGLGVEDLSWTRWRSSGSLLQRISWMFVLLNVLLAVLAVVALSYPGAPPWPAAGIQTGAFVGLAFWAVAYHLSRGRWRVLDLAPFPLLLVGGLVSGSTDDVFGRLYVALFLHALYRPGGWRHTLLLSSFYVATYETVGWVTTGGGRHVVQIVSTVISVLVVTWIMQTLSLAVVRHERTTARNAILTEVIAALLSERDLERIGGVVAAGASRLVGTPGAVVTVWRGNAQRLQRVGVVGAASSVIEVRIDALPQDVRGAYLGGRTEPLVRMQRPTVTSDPYELPLEHGCGLVATVPGAHTPVGMILITSPEPLDSDLTATMQRFAYEVSLAEQLAERDALLASVVASSPDLIAVVDRDSRFTYLSPALTALAGMDPTELVGKPIGSLLTGVDDDAPVEAFDLALQTPVPLRLTGATTSLDVEATVSRLGTDALVLNVRDVSERRRLEEEITYRAFHDTLTGLANRALFLDRLTHALQRSDRTGSAVAVAMVDLDGFKAINDRFGHAAGDQLLVEVARRIRATGREADTAARLGGDEFAVLIDGVDGDRGAAAAASRLVDALRPPVVAEGHDLSVSASVGVVVVDDAASGPDEVLRNADIAMYAAKAAGKNQHAIFGAGTATATNLISAVSPDTRPVE